MVLWRLAAARSGRPNRAGQLLKRNSASWGSTSNPSCSRRTSKATSRARPTHSCRGAGCQDVRRSLALGYPCRNGADQERQNRDQREQARPQALSYATPFRPHGAGFGSRSTRGGSPPKTSISIEPPRHAAELRMRPEQPRPHRPPTPGPAAAERRSQPRSSRAAGHHPSPAPCSVKPAGSASNGSRSTPAPGPSTRAPPGSRPPHRRS